MTLDSLNIRKGLELEVEVSDIFSIETKAQGDIVAKEIYEKGWEVYLEEHPGDYNKVIDSNGLIYESEKTKVKISENLIAYVYDSYLVSADVLNDEEGSEESEEPVEYEIVADRCKEIEFVNTKILNFDEFCVNVMDAQKFVGKYETSIFRSAFYGYGEFSMEDYYGVHKMVSISTIHTLKFFIKHKNILAGIGSFVTGLYRNDILKQREYLTPKEFVTILDESERQFALVSSLIEKNFL